MIGNTRTAIRREVIGWFLEEAPGTGKGDYCSKYHYKVENLSGSAQVLLRRPARFNKGFDFGVAVPGTNFGKIRKSDMPTHQNIIEDLLHKRSANGYQFGLAMQLVERTFRCENIDDNEVFAIGLQQAGYPFDHVLKVIKWLFIEQDITYWNWSGRTMFYLEILKAVEIP